MKPKMNSKSIGRPRRDIDLSEIGRLASLGLTQQQIGAIVGVSERGLRERLGEDDGVRAAYEKGRAEALAKVAGKLWQKIEDGDTVSILFYLKCRGGWSERTELHHLVERGGGVNEDLARRMAAEYMVGAGSTD